MIRRVTLRRFKRFREVVFNLPGHVVLAGPNNTGKTTLLQAIAAWDLAFRRWKELNNFQRRGGSYERAPIARQSFSAVPLREFDLLWTMRDVENPIEIEIESTARWTITMELLPDTSEQIKVRPKNNAAPPVVRRAQLSTVFVPAMTGLSTAEPLYARPEFLDTMLAQARPGEILRNLLFNAAGSEDAWRAIRASIERLFGYEILPPNATGAYIVSEYRMDPQGPTFDIASAGSGFQQILMLLTFLNTHPGSLLLLDEPDAHLHLILQDAIYGELRRVAAEKRSQLILATHSEVIINTVDARELCVMLSTPRMLATTEERERLIRSLGILTNAEIMLADDAPGVLYLEGETDLEILRAWARILNHPALELLTTNLFWRKTVSQHRGGAPGVAARDHYAALRLVRDDLPGLEVLDGDAHPDIEASEITGSGLQRVRWRRYEIESYLIHPTALERFLERQLGSDAASLQARREMITHLERVFRKEFLGDPLNPEPLVENYLRTTKARTEILPPILSAAGLPGFPYTRYHEIAAVMEPEEIHPEVVEKLDAICKAFNRA